MAAGVIGTTPALAVNRELVELQTQVQALSDQITTLKQSLDERMGVLKNLMDQNTDSINKVTVGHQQHSDLAAETAERHQRATWTKSPDNCSR